MDRLLKCHSLWLQTKWSPCNADDGNLHVYCVDWVHCAKVQNCQHWMNITFGRWWQIVIKKAKSTHSKLPPCQNCIIVGSVTQVIEKESLNFVHKEQSWTTKWSTNLSAHFYCMYWLRKHMTKSNSHRWYFSLVLMEYVDSEWYATVGFWCAMAVLLVRGTNYVWLMFHCHISKFSSQVVKYQCHSAFTHSASTPLMFHWQVTGNINVPSI